MCELTILVQTTPKNTKPAEVSTTAAASATPESKWELLYDIGDHIGENTGLIQIFLTVGTKWIIKQ